MENQFSFRCLIISISILIKKINIYNFIVCFDDSLKFSVMKISLSYVVWNTKSVMANYFQRYYEMVQNFEAQMVDVYGR
jgi:hypothetical protein